MTRRRIRGRGAVDHRARVGRLRRSRTEGRILEAALRVFAEKGPDAPVVEDFVQAAGISRGTFYNHFEGIPPLLEATSVWTTGSAVAAIEEALGSIEDPALRVATGLRLFLGKAKADPVWSQFVARVWKLGSLDGLVRDLGEGRRLGMFRFPDRDVALDVLLGGLRQALFRIGDERTPAAYAGQVVEVCLQGLGADRRRIAQVLTHVLPALRPPRASGAPR